MKRVVLWGAAAVASAAALSGCEKPYPGVTVWSGTNSEFKHALCWSFDAAEPVDELRCAQNIISGAETGNEIPRLSVMSGNTVGISVDPVIADNGWFPVINNQRLIPEPIYSTYWRFTFPDFEQIPESGIELQVRANGEGENARGIWVFQLERGTAE